MINEGGVASQTSYVGTHIHTVHTHNVEIYILICKNWAKIIPNYTDCVTTVR